MASHPLVQKEGSWIRISEKRCITDYCCHDAMWLKAAAVCSHSQEGRRGLCSALLQWAPSHVASRLVVRPSGLTGLCFRLHVRPGWPTSVFLLGQRAGPCVPFSWLWQRRERARATQKAGLLRSGLRAGMLALLPQCSSPSLLLPYTAFLDNFFP